MSQAATLGRTSWRPTHGRRSDDLGRSVGSRPLDTGQARLRRRAREPRRGGARIRGQRGRRRDALRHGGDVRRRRVGAPARRAGPWAGRPDRDEVPAEHAVAGRGDAPSARAEPGAPPARDGRPVHAPLPDAPGVDPGAHEPGWRTPSEQGKVRAVGVSNYSASQMRLAHDVLARRGIPLASNQIEYSLIHRQPETDGVLDALPRAGGDTHRQPAAGQRSADRQVRGRRAAIRLQALHAALPGAASAGDAPVVALLREIGDAVHGRSPAQVALRWLIENAARACRSPARRTSAGCRQRRCPRLLSSLAPRSRRSIGPPPPGAAQRNELEAADPTRYSDPADAGAPMSWQALADAAPELAAFGAGRMHDQVAYLATLKTDGSPRLHPVRPVVSSGRLFMFVEATSARGPRSRA